MGMEAYRHFSTWMHGEVTAASDILAIDHFVYAAKFQPLFPFLMVSSALVIVFLLAGSVLKNKKTIMNGFLLTMAVLLFGASAGLADSPTAGLSFFASYFAILGISIFFYLAFRLTKEKNQTGGKTPSQSMFNSRNE